MNAGQDSTKRKSEVKPGDSQQRKGRRRLAQSAQAAEDMGNETFVPETDSDDSDGYNSSGSIDDEVRSARDELVSLKSPPGGADTDMDIVNDDDDTKDEPAPVMRAPVAASPPVIQVIGNGDPTLLLESQDVFRYDLVPDDATMDQVDRSFVWRSLTVEDVVIVERAKKDGTWLIYLSTRKGVTAAEKVGVLPPALCIQTPFGKQMWPNLEYRSGNHSGSLKKERYDNLKAKGLVGFGKGVKQGDKFHSFLYNDDQMTSEYSASLNSLETWGPASITKDGQDKHVVAFCEWTEALTRWLMCQYVTRKDLNAFSRGKQIMHELTKTIEGQIGLCARFTDEMLKTDKDREQRRVSRLLARRDYDADGDDDDDDDVLFEGHDEPLTDDERAELERSLEALVTPKMILERCTRPKKEKILKTFNTAYIKKERTPFGFQATKCVARFVKPLIAYTRKSEKRPNPLAVRAADDVDLSSSSAAVSASVNAQLTDETMKAAGIKFNEIPIYTTRGKKIETKRSIGNGDVVSFQIQLKMDVYEGTLKLWFELCSGIWWKLTDVGGFPKVNVEPTQMSFAPEDKISDATGFVLSDLERAQVEANRAQSIREAIVRMEEKKAKKKAEREKAQADAAMSADKTA